MDKLTEPKAPWLIPGQSILTIARAAEGQPWIAHYLQSIGAKPRDDDDSDGEDE